MTFEPLPAQAYSAQERAAIYRAIDERAIQNLWLAARRLNRWCLMKAGAAALIG